MPSDAHKERPPGVSDALYEKALTYLDGLRESGITNMWGAAPYLQRAYPAIGKGERRNHAGTSPTATALTLHWMATFSDRHPEPTSDR